MKRTCSNSSLGLRIFLLDLQSTSAWRIPNDNCPDFFSHCEVSAVTNSVNPINHDLLCYLIGASRVSDCTLSLNQILQISDHDHSACRFSLS